jgi:hypothetical protein
MREGPTAVPSHVVGFMHVELAPVWLPARRTCWGRSERLSVQEQARYKAAPDSSKTGAGEKGRESMATLWFAIVLMLASLGRCVPPAGAEGGKYEEEHGTVQVKEKGVSVTRPLLRLAQKPPSSRSQDRWYWLTPPSGGKRLDALAYGGNTFVALLNPGGTKVITPGGSTTLASHDGREWSAGEIKTEGVYSHLTYGAGLFVAVGRGVFGAHGGTIVTSSDGRRWTERAATTHELTHVFYGNKRFVALGLRGAIAVSVNGVEWKESSTASYGHLYAGAYGNGAFVLVGDISLVTSADAYQWARHANQDLGVPFGLRQIAFGQNAFLLGSEYALFTSAEGTQWRRNTMDLWLREIGYTPKIFLALSEDGGVFTSAEGTQWTPGPRVLEAVEGVSCRTHRCSVLGKRILAIGPG